jgi:hypothetical protein
VIALRPAASRSAILWPRAGVQGGFCVFEACTPS